MTFTNILFLFYFLPIILILYFLAPRKHRNSALFAGSLIFCAWGEPLCFLALLAVMLVTYISSNKLLEIKDVKKRKIIFGLTIFLDILFFLLSGVASEFIPFINSMNYIGFLFVTLRLISFSTDIYRKEIEQRISFINFGTYIMMFPKMIVGPLENYADFAPQLISRIGTIEGFSRGFMRFVVGFAKKVLLADVLYELWVSTSRIPLTELSVASSWLGMIAFGFSIYYSLSGYSDMAIGLGKMFGFQYSENFNYPILATSVTEFFRRWLMSLTDWLKKYVTAPLVKNYKLKVTVCIFITSVFFGVAHGFGTSKIVWGIYIGLILVLERRLASEKTKRLPKIIKWIYTAFLVTIGWVLFASSSFSDIFNFFKIMFGFSGNKAISSEFLYDISSNIVIIALAVLSALPFGAKKGREYIEKNPLYALIPVFLGYILCLAYVLA